MQYPSRSACVTPVILHGFHSVLKEKWTYLEDVAKICWGAFLPTAFLGSRHDLRQHSGWIGSRLHMYLQKIQPVHLEKRKWVRAGAEWWWSLCLASQEKLSRTSTKAWSKLANIFVIARDIESRAQSEMQSTRPHPYRKRKFSGKSVMDSNHLTSWLLQHASWGYWVQCNCPQLWFLIGALWIQPIIQMNSKTNFCIFIAPKWVCFWVKDLHHENTPNKIQNVVHPVWVCFQHYHPGSLLLCPELSRPTYLQKNKLRRSTLQWLPSC